MNTQAPARERVQTLAALDQPAALLKSSTILAATGWSRATLYRRIADGTFPSPVKINSHMARWPSRAVREYLDRVAGVQA